MSLVPIALARPEDPETLLLWSCVVVAGFVLTAWIVCVIRDVVRLRARGLQVPASDTRTPRWIPLSWTARRVALLILGVHAAVTLPSAPPAAADEANPEAEGSHPGEAARHGTQEADRTSASRTGGTPNRLSPLFPDTARVESAETAEATPKNTPPPGASRGAGTRDGGADGDVSRHEDPTPGAVAPGTRQSPGLATVTSDLDVVQGGAEQAEYGARASKGVGQQEPDHWVVLRGQTLWEIAGQVLGPGAEPADLARAVAALHTANADVLTRGPDLLLPGQVLTIPDDLDPRP